MRTKITPIKSPPFFFLSFPWGIPWQIKVIYTTWSPIWFIFGEKLNFMIENPNLKFFRNRTIIGRFMAVWILATLASLVSFEKSYLRRYQWWNVKNSLVLLPLKISSRGINRQRLSVSFGPPNCRNEFSFAIFTLFPQKIWISDNKFRFYIQNYIWIAKKNFGYRPSGVV